MEIIIAVAVVLFFIYINSPIKAIGTSTVLTDGKEHYIFVRWNWYAVNGLTRNGDVVLIRIKLLKGKCYEILSGEFYDDSNLYKRLDGWGIRPY